MRHLTTSDGVRVAYDVKGVGPPIILHLGAGCDSSLWEAAGYLGPLKEKYTCVLFDHRGHGGSDRPRGAEAHHIDRYVADVVELLEHLGIDRASFWGYSNGGIVGLKLADAHPDRIAAFIGTGECEEPSAGEIPDLVARVVASHRENGWEQLIARFDDSEPGGVPDWMKERIRATDMEQFDGWLEAWPHWEWSVADALGRVRVPTLFLVGELEDGHDYMAQAAAAMPNATRIRLVGKGHIRAFIDSDAVLPAVLDFLAQHAS